MTRCCVPHCSHNANHRFPKDPDLRKSWLKAMRRENFVPKNGSRICHRHFHRGDFVQISRVTGVPLQHRCLKKAAVPSVFPWNRKFVSSRHEIREERRTRHHRCRSFDETPAWSKHGEDSKSVESDIEFLWHKTVISRPGRRNCLLIKQFSQGTQTPNSVRLFVSTEMLLSDDESVLFYTGLDNFAQFKLLLSTLMPMAYNIKFQSNEVNELTPQDQFLMLLIKLRRCKPDFEIGKIFGVNKVDVSNVIVTWISFITDHWSVLDNWPNQDVVNSYMPESLKTNALNRALVDDGIPIEEENFHNAVQASFSQYSLNKSLKFIAGCSSDGLICYCLEKHVPSTGDLQIRDDDMSPISKVMSLDQKLAKSISMEKLVGSTKTYKILASAPNQIYAPLSARIFSVCLMICSFKVGIVTVNKRLN